MEKDEEVPGGGLLIFWEVEGRLAARLTKGLPSDHWKSPSMVRSFKPIHWYSRYWSGGTGGLRGHSRPPAPPNRAQGLEAVFWGVWGAWARLGSGEGSPGEGSRAPVSPPVPGGFGVPITQRSERSLAPFCLSFPTLNPAGRGSRCAPPWLPGPVGSVPSPRTVDEVLLLGGQDGGQVPPVVPALRLRVLPAPPGGEVLVAGSLEAVPAGAAPPQR